MALPSLSNLPSVRPAPVRPVVKADDDAADRDGARSLSSPQQRSGVLSTALSMHDDLSALVSSLQRRRDNPGGAETRESAAWVDHILDDGVHHKLAQLRQLLPGMNAGADVLAMLRNLFNDPSDVLAVVRALLADDQLEALHELLNDALDQLLAEQRADGTAAQVQGGLNVAVKARLAAQGGFLDARQLRHSYRDFLANSRDCLGQYARWIALYGFDRRGLIVEFMEQAVATDMYSLDPSGSHLEFGHLLGRVRTLTVVRSTDQMLIQHCTRQGLLLRLQVPAETIVARLLDIVRGLEDWAAMFSGPLAAARVVLTDSERAQWIQSIRRALHALPDALWRDEQARERMRGALEVLVTADVTHGALRGRTA